MNEHSKHQATPSDFSRPETRGEATEARKGLFENIATLLTSGPRFLERQSAKFMAYMCAIIIGILVGAAVWDMRAQLAEVRSENSILRDKLTDYLVTANTATASALDRNSAALAENSRVMHRIEQTLDTIKRTQ